MTRPTARTTLLTCALLCCATADAAAQGGPAQAGPSKTPPTTRPIGPLSAPDGINVHRVPEFNIWGHTVPGESGPGTSWDWNAPSTSGAPTPGAAMALSITDLRTVGALCSQKGADGKAPQEHADFKPFCGRVATQIAYWLAFIKKP